MQAGRRQFLDELTEEERDELIEAQLVRAETIEEPPLRPEAYIEPWGEPRHRADGATALG